MTRSGVRITLKHCPRCGKFDVFIGKQKYCDNCKLEVKRNRYRKVKTVGVTQVTGEGGSGILPVRGAP